MLATSKESQGVQECLGKRNFGGMLLKAYQAECEKVVELKEEVRMVASTSSSSVGGGGIEIVKKDVEKFSERMRDLHELDEIDEELEHAEESSDNLSSRDSDRRNGEDTTGESDEESSSYKPPL